MRKWFKGGRIVSSCCSLPGRRWMEMSRGVTWELLSVMFTSTLTPGFSINSSPQPLSISWAAESHLRLMCAPSRKLCYSKIHIYVVQIKSMVQFIGVFIFIENTTLVWMDVFSSVLLRQEKKSASSMQLNWPLTGRTVLTQPDSKVKWRSSAKLSSNQHWDLKPGPSNREGAILFSFELETLNSEQSGNMVVEKIRAILYSKWVPVQWGL